MVGEGRKRVSKKIGAKVNLSDEEKQKLAGIVQLHPELWDLCHPLHRRPDTHNSVWENISKEMDYSAEVCRKTWKSLKDGLRYRKAPKSVKRKSGDSAPDDSENEEIREPDSELITWPFWDCMQFYASQKSNRVTTSSAVTEENSQAMLNERPSVDSEIGEPAVDLSTPKKSVDSSEDRKGSNYSYAVNRKKARTADSTEKLANGIADLIKLRKDACSNSKDDQLLYHSMFANLDRMFKQLPALVVEELNMQFVGLTYDAIKRQQMLVIINDSD